VDPAGTVLRQFCVPLVAQTGGDLGSWQAEQFAAELLALHFGGRADVLAELDVLARPWSAPYAGQTHFTDGMLCALGEGWPESDLLGLAWEQLGGEDDDHHGHAEGAIAFLWAARSDPSQLMSWIDRRIRQQRRVQVPSRRARRRALVGRFRRDEDLRGAAGEIVLDPSSSPSRRTSMLNLLLSSGAVLEPDVSRYVRDQLIALSKGAPTAPYSDIGFDVLSGEDATTLMVLTQSIRQPV
jgi:hypothetical protein